MGDFKGHGTFTLPDWPDDWIDALQRYDAREGRPAAAREGAEEPPTQHHIWCNIQSGPVESCRMCSSAEGLHALYPQGQISGVELMSKHFPGNVHRPGTGETPLAEPAGAEPQRPQGTTWTESGWAMRGIRRSLSVWWMNGGGVCDTPLNAEIFGDPNATGLDADRWEAVPVTRTVQVHEPVAHPQTPAPTPERPA
jgi:hypothetical protein